MAKKKGNRRVRSASVIAINDGFSAAGGDGDALMGDGLTVEEMEDY
jgi:hypothetical protein